ncbi:hypothetical protein A9K55_004503 [Cordyceps militaris]|uniref:Uncharacterized protein n=1 Tax=Cordyceps militaris TaxID=73501 RepID=A0A2H4SM34_CORMI|nr:hypothetical protein A9K55_004503 [Cordyceps militaris]
MCRFETVNFSLAFKLYIQLHLGGQDHKHALPLVCHNAKHKPIPFLCLYFCSSFLEELPAVIHRSAWALLEYQARPDDMGKGPPKPNKKQFGSIRASKTESTREGPLLGDSSCTALVGIPPVTQLEQSSRGLLEEYSDSAPETSSTYNIYTSIVQDGGQIRNMRHHKPITTARCRAPSLASDFALARISAL